MLSFMTYNEMGRMGGRDQSAVRTWPCACARMCHAYIRQLAHVTMTESLPAFALLVMVVLCRGFVSLLANGLLKMFHFLAVHHRTMHDRTLKVSECDVLHSVLGNLTKFTTCVQLGTDIK